MLSPLSTKKQTKTSRQVVKSNLFFLYWKKHRLEKIISNSSDLYHQPKIGRGSLQTPLSKWDLQIPQRILLLPACSAQCFFALASFDWLHIFWSTLDTRHHHILTQTSRGSSFIVVVDFLKNLSKLLVPRWWKKPPWRPDFEQQFMVFKMIF